MTLTLRDRLTVLLHDPDYTVLHRALRVAIVTPLLFAFGMLVLKDGEFSLLAAFGSFSAMAMADFMGPARSRLNAYISLGLTGIVLVGLGTLLSNTLWAATVAMLVIGLGLQFVAALGGQYALGNTAAILAFVVAVMVPAGPEAVVPRLLGWLAAIVGATITTALLWPRHQHRDFYERLAAACRALATTAQALADNGPGQSDFAAAQSAIASAREAQQALGYRPVGPAGQQQALLGLIDELGQYCRLAPAMRPEALTAADRRLAAAIATALRSVGDVLQGIAAEVGAPLPDIAALAKARHEHRRGLEQTVRNALAADVKADSVLALAEAAFPIRILSFTALTMTADATVLLGCRAQLNVDDFGIVEPTEPGGALPEAAKVLAPHLSPRSIWFRNSLRAAIALALSVLVAKASDIQHAFWVVLATLTVLRSNVATTGSTVVSAVLGTFAGFILATVVMLAIGDHTLVLWLSLPLAVFLSGYAPAAVSLAAGQAMFALLVVELFNLIVPAGWETGAVRLEAVVLGAAVALVSSLIMWPKGAAAVLRAEVSFHIRAAQRLTSIVFGALLGTNDGSAIASAREASLEARHRAEEALGAYTGERGAKHVPLPVLASLVRVPVSMRTGDDAVIVMWRAHYGATGNSPLTRLLQDTVTGVCASYDELADRLDHPGLAPDAGLAALVADLDIIHGPGLRYAEIAEAAADWVDAERRNPKQDPNTVTSIIGLVWAARWLSYLAHLRVASERALEEVQTYADTPWWR